jgi:peptide/nickel transport system permease protein
VSSIVKRLAVAVITALVTALIASVLIYGAVYFTPGDPATLFVGNAPVSPDVLAAIRAQHHLDDPLWLQYWHWITSLLGGDLGQSFVYREDVSKLLADRAVNSLFLVIYASVLIVVAGVSLGLFAALRGPAVRALVTVSTAISMAVPVFVAAIVLIAVFAVGLGWFPVFGSGEGFADRLWHMTLPAVSLALAYLAFVSQVTRESIETELARDHVFTARGRGLPPGRVIRRHVFRNALAPITTVTGITIAGMLAGAIIAEQAFGISGLGSFLVDAVRRKDFAVVQVISLIIVVSFIVLNGIVDAVNAALDPRLRTEARR